MTLPPKFMTFAREDLVGKVINLVGKVGGQEPGVIGPGFRVEKSGLRLQGSRCRVQDVELRV